MRGETVKDLDLHAMCRQLGAHRVHRGVARDGLEVEVKTEGFSYDIRGTDGPDLVGVLVGGRHLPNAPLEEQASDVAAFGGKVLQAGLRPFEEVHPVAHLVEPPLDQVDVLVVGVGIGQGVVVVEPKDVVEARDGGEELTPRGVVSARFDRDRSA